MGTVKDKFVGKVRQAAGFTLIELLVVVAIIGILAAIAIPIFLSQTNKAKDAGAQSNVTSAITETGSLTPSFSTYPATLTGSTELATALGKEDESIHYTSGTITAANAEKNEVKVVTGAEGVALFSIASDGTVYCSNVTSASSTKGGGAEKAHSNATAGSLTECT